MKSKRKSQSSQKRLSQSEKPNITEEELDDIISDITLKRGRNAYTIYICEMLKKEKEEDESVKLTDVVKKYSPKWPKVSDKEKDRYEKQSEAEKEKFKKDVETVKHYLFSYVKQGATAYRLFLDKKLRDAFDSDEDPKEVKKQAAEDWAKMSSEERREWNELKKQNDTWWEKARHSKTINAYAVFVQRKAEEYKKNDEAFGFKDCSKLWKKASDKEKKKYAKYAEELNEERKKMREYYEIAKGIKPRRPMGAFKIFLQEMANEGKFNGKNAFKEGRKLWDELSEDEKEAYLKKAHKIKLCYIYKNMLFKQKMKKALPPKPPSAYNLFVQSMKGKNIPEGKTFIQYVFEKWDNMNDEDKEVFEKKAEKLKSKYDIQREKMEDKVFDYPKKAKSSYQLFVSERVIALKEEKPKADTRKLFAQCADEWNQMENSEKKKYEKQAKKDRARYKSQIEEFEEQGYYTKKESERKSTQSQKKKSQKMSQSQKKDKK